MTSLNEALPLTNGIFNRFQFLLVDYMQNVHPWMKQIFNKASYAYDKDDLASIQRPGVLVTCRNATMKSFSYGIRGYVDMELHFMLREVRSSLAQNVIQISNDIFNINLAHGFTVYLRERMYGLVHFGKEITVDLSQVYKAESIVKISFDWLVDAQAYQNELIRGGFDITSPDEEIYLPAQELLEGLAVLNPDQSVAFVRE